MASLIRHYRRLLHERPFITNVLTSSAFMTIGDLTSQSLIQRREIIDLRQTARFAIAGLIFVGPVARSCLVAIDKVFGPTSSLVVLAKKLFVDQLMIAPCFIIGNITTLTLLQHGTFDKVSEELNRSYFNILKLNYTFWPFVQMCNFYFIPLTYRVLFGSSCALAWNTIFSYRLYNKSSQNTADGEL